MSHVAATTARACLILSIILSCAGAVVLWRRLRKHSKALQGSCDLLICDEAHRQGAHPPAALVHTELVPLAAYV